jgi:hypothetical protein
MRTGETLAAAFWLLVALVITWSGWDLGLGTLGDPGPGGMIFWVGAIMSALCLAAMWTALRSSSGRAADRAPNLADDGAVDGARGEGSRLEPPRTLAGLWHGTRWWLVPYVVALLALYAWLLPALGFLATTTLLLLVLFLTIDRRSWIGPPVGAVLATLAVYIVFHRWLGTQLPAGDVERWLATYLPALFGRS